MAERSKKQEEFPKMIRNLELRHQVPDPSFAHAIQTAATRIQLEPRRNNEHKRLVAEYYRLFSLMIDRQGRDQPDGNSEQIAI